MSQVVTCPKCNAAVSVTADQGGKRVQCPSCLQQFLAPSTIGSAGSTAEDEDWLSLDDAPVAASPSPNPAPVPTTPKAPASPSSQFGDDLLANAEAAFEQDDILDESPFVQTEPSGADPTDLFADLPPLGGPSAGAGSPGNTGSPGSTGPPGNIAQSIDPDDEFRVKCSVCGTVLYAKARQTGSTITCSDCFTEIRVPKPPKKTEKPQHDPNAATFNLADTGSQGRPADPFQRSAAELLHEAEKEPDEEEFSSPVDVPSVTGWFKSIFGIFLDPGVIIHFVGLSLFLAIPAALCYAYPVFAIGMVPLVLIGVTLTVSCGFAILMSVANEHERIEDWPTIDPVAWFESLWLVIAATAVAVGPAYVLSTLLAAPAVLKIGLVMFAVYAMFPIILLSMLDMQSVTSPFSASVSKSITRCQEDWGTFYFTSGLMFAGLFMFFSMSSYSPTSVGIGVTLSIGAAFLYFAMLGRLALAIGKVVDIAALDAGDDEDES